MRQAPYAACGLCRRRAQPMWSWGYMVSKGARRNRLTLPCGEGASYCARRRGGCSRNFSLAVERLRLVGATEAGQASHSASCEPPQWVSTYLGSDPYLDAAMGHSFDMNQVTNKPTRQPKITSATLWRPSSTPLSFEW